MFSCGKREGFVYVLAEVYPIIYTKLFVFAYTQCYLMLKRYFKGRLHFRLRAKQQVLAERLTSFLDTHQPSVLIKQYNGNWAEPEHDMDFQFAL